MSLGKESETTIRFINQYFDRPDAYDSLISGRNIPKEQLDSISDKHLASSKAKQELETLLAERNRLSEKLKNPAIRTTAEGTAAVARSSEIGKLVPEHRIQVDKTSSEYLHAILSLPNPPSDRTPIGKDESENPVVRLGGPKRNYKFEPKLHYELLEKLGLILEGTPIVGQPKFPILLGEAATLEDALRNFFTNFHRGNRRFEVNPPHMVSRTSLSNTGQLPKFERELYHVYPGGEKDDLFLIPTAEVPLTNLVAGKTISDVDLPIQIFGYSRCFRVEAGSSGKDSQGLKRVHDFGKVEMIDVVKPSQSWQALEDMARSAENILQQLDIDYRIIILCTGDLPAGNAFTYDLETRIPDYGWREVSSCSNCLDYQSRRARIRFKQEDTGKVELVHTLNGSAFPTGRMVAAVVEQYQEKDGSITIPEQLRKYTNFDNIKAWRNPSYYFQKR